MPTKPAENASAGAGAGAGAAGAGAGAGAGVGASEAGGRNDAEDDDEDPRARVSEAQLQALRRDRDITAALADPALQKLVIDVDSASDSVAALEAAKLRDPRFAAFVDQLLLSIGACVQDKDKVVFVGKPSG